MLRHNRSFYEILLSELESKLADYDIHDILAEYEDSMQVIQSDMEDYLDEYPMPNIGSIGEPDSALDIAENDLNFLRSIFREDYIKDVDAFAQNTESSKSHELFLDSTSPFFSILQEIDSRAPNVCVTIYFMINI